MENQGWWNDEKEKAWKEETKKQVTFFLNIRNRRYEIKNSFIHTKKSFQQINWVFYLYIYIYIAFYTYR